MPSVTESSAVTISCLHRSLTTFRMRSDSGTHSVFSDPDMFRGFTHHSNYPGDAIFSHRSHQPQQHFEYGVGGIGLGLPEIRVSTSHSLQVPGGHLHGIDNIGLTAITLQDSSIDLGYDANPGGVYEIDSPDPVPGSGYVSPHSIDLMDPIAAATAAGVPQNSTPPATPTISSRRAPTTTTTNAGNTVAQTRSSSVPLSRSRPAILSHRQPSDQSGVNSSTRNAMEVFEHIISASSAPPVWAIFWSRFERSVE
jgi:hypothetical protein